MEREATGGVRLDGRETASSSPAEPAIHRASRLRRRLRPNWMAAQAQTDASYLLPHRASGECPLKTVLLDDEGYPVQ
jgi:hypothetical protein